MQVKIEPGYTTGVITPPPSKSIAQRIFAAALLHHGKTIIHNAGSSSDELAMMDSIQALGAKVLAHEDGILEITGSGISPLSQTINCNESGLAARLMIPIAATSELPITITGTGSLLHRPLGVSQSMMDTLGVSMQDNNGHLPITVMGPMKPVDITIDGSQGSQLLSGLLFAYSCCATQKVTIHVTNLTSKPYIDMTLDALAQFGKPIIHERYKRFYIDPSLFTDPGVVTATIENDWSSAAYWLVASAVAGKITVCNLSLHSKQADRAIINVLQMAGAVISETPGAITVDGNSLQPFDFVATDCPDLFPILCILAACCRGESYIYGVHRLFHKESNRVASIADMLWGFGIPFSVEDDAFCVTGVESFHSAVIDTYHDHRIAMAASIGALRADGSVTIQDAGCVNKSYPHFFKDLVLLGGKCEMVE